MANCCVVRGIKPEEMWCYRSDSASSLPCYLLFLTYSALTVFLFNNSKYHLWYKYIYSAEKTCLISTTNIIVIKRGIMKYVVFFVAHIKKLFNFFPPQDIGIKIITNAKTRKPSECINYLTSTTGKCFSQHIFFLSLM